jgi:protein phosphatase 1 regulatory subunit 3A/B/C/D/E
MFQQPGSFANFFDLLRDNKVMLENAYVSAVDQRLVRTAIRVVNLDFHKTVSVRVSTDEWRTATDVPAEYGNGADFRYQTGYTICFIRSEGIKF